jgi:hypothetical protein
MPTTIDCVVARAKRDSDPSTDAETNCDTLGAPAEQPDDQSDPSTDRDAEGRPEVLGLGHVVSSHDESRSLRIGGVIQAAGCSDQPDDGGQRYGSRGDQGGDVGRRHVWPDTVRRVSSLKFVCCQQVGDAEHRVVADDGPDVVDGRVGD